MTEKDGFDPGRIDRADFEDGVKKTIEFSIAGSGGDLVSATLDIDAGYDDDIRMASIYLFRTTEGAYYEGLSYELFKNMVLAAQDEGCNVLQFEVTLLSQEQHQQDEAALQDDVIDSAAVLAWCFCAYFTESGKATDIVRVHQGPNEYAIQTVEPEEMREIVSFLDASSGATPPTEPATYRFSAEIM